MKKNNLKDYTDQQLIREMQSRGYKMDLIIGPPNIKYHLKNINIDRWDEELSPVRFEQLNSKKILNEIAFIAFWNEIDDLLFEIIGDHVNKIDHNKEFNKTP